MGNNFAKALSKGMKCLSHEIVNLSDNRLTQEGSLSVILELKPSLKYLDLSNNILGASVAKVLGDFIKRQAIK